MIVASAIDREGVDPRSEDSVVYSMDLPACNRDPRDLRSGRFRSYSRMTRGHGTSPMYDYLSWMKLACEAGADFGGCDGDVAVDGGAPVAAAGDDVDGVGGGVGGGGGGVDVAGDDFALNCQHGSCSRPRIVGPDRSGQM